VRYIIAVVLIALGSVGAAPQTTEPRFEVVSVKENHSADDRTTIRTSPNQFQFVNFPLRGILEYAFSVAGHPYLLIAVPGWADSERYDVTAKIPPSARRNATPQMVRQLLEDRFHLKVRVEARQRDVYFLRRAATPLGRKLQPSSLDCTKRVESPLSRGLPACGLTAGGTGKLSFVKAGGATVDLLADVLSEQVGRPVVNETGLMGIFNIDLEFDSASIRPLGLDGPQQSSAPSVFTAVREQLGLLLQSGSAPIDHIVIDYIERPTEN
jgi:uncharacterized protein (TIGR03435 family)